jgi:hypothetical protein
MIAKRHRPRLTLVGLTGTPRADAEIKRTIEKLGRAQFEQDPLFDIGGSLRLSLFRSARQREGPILEAAIKDAIDQTEHLRLSDQRVSNRRIAVQFELLEKGWFIGLEIKRGALHDSGATQQFRTDLKTIPNLLRAALPLFPEENVLFHIVFVSGVPPIKDGLTLDDLGQLYGLHARSHILTARQRYSTAIKSVLRERGL